ncbi:c-type cytochrome [Oxalobacteraceae bacterium A2-2]
MQSTQAVLLLAALFHGAATAAPAPAGDPVAGKAAFYKCASCHQVGASARGGFGPQLNGIIGRPAAITRDFQYSTALKNSRLVWNEANLAAFLRGPSDLVPGTKMRFWGISDERQIANLLAYMRTFPAYAEAPR